MDGIKLRKGIDNARYHGLLRRCIRQLLQAGYIYHRISLVSNPQGKAGPFRYRRFQAHLFRCRPVGFRIHQITKGRFPDPLFPGNPLHHRHHKAVLCGII